MRDANKLPEKVGHPVADEVLSEEENRADEVARRLWAELSPHIESFPEELYPDIAASLRRANSSLSIFRRELFILYVSSVEFSIDVLEAKNHNLKLVRRSFLATTLTFLSKDELKWGRIDDFRLRRDAYRSALTGYLNRTNESGEDRNILIPVRELFWPSVMGSGSNFTNEFTLGDAHILKNFIDSFVDKYLFLFQLGLKEIQKQENQAF